MLADGETTQSSKGCAMTAGMVSETAPQAAGGHGAGTASGSGSTKGVLNPQYPMSYWQIAFSHDLANESVIPLRVLERDVVLWRDSAGTVHCMAAHCLHLGANLGYGGEVVKDSLRCPFHAWRYGPDGKVVHVPGIDGALKTKRCLPTFRVIERYGTIFLWNGPEPADHDLPDFLADEGIAEDSILFEHVRYKLPFPAKWFVENLPDSAHFAGLHRLGSWGDTEIIAQSETRIEYVCHFHGRAPYVGWEDVKRSYRRGEMWGVSDAAGGDFHATTYGGGLHLIDLTASPPELAESRARVTARVPRATIALTEKINELSDSARLILSFTPVDVDSHIVYLTMIVPKIKNPVLRLVGRPLVRSLLVRRNWFAIMQDTALMMYRQEPKHPSYNRFDRGLVRFRRFWDSRLLDRSLWAGDNVHSAGARAGCAWPDDPTGPAGGTGPTGGER
ncbi:phenylpropionate dioxygenase-like ring-hydroxylating dioxygenase large terminal subunit [Mycolicibacterium sp. BK556]|uniref:Rieske 2Fe-2S domain-containing protein n=2 Tax=Mycolicibacterium TaxID=1866885 RepID=UPI00161FD805|nr:phenylpropionate dioxygenase-like ring-hydroxylating dioxygenase large terminal subunit [Mycolicibacterium sp. BK556]MBB3748638.1 phenylpropionate dioxygenase-like ring-hydroxylating dioxygenase large terminal subunit [Mycolicibacterium sp. BK634]